MNISPEKQHLLSLLFSEDAANIELALALAQSQHIWIDPYLELVDYMYSLSNSQDKTVAEKLSNIRSYTHLHFTNRKLSAFTDSFRYVPHLEIIGLEGNLLSDIPDYFSNYTALQEFRLRNNAFAHFPLVLTQMPSLQYLFLNNNNIAEIPPEIGKMTNLQGLYLGNNRLTSLPIELQQLQQLKKVSLADNPLDFKRIPSALFEGDTALAKELARLKRYL